MDRLDLPPEQLIDLALEAIGDRDPDRLRPLLHEDARVVTERGEHVGAAAVSAWARKGYDHLDRRFAAERVEPAGGGLLVTGRVDYVWRDSGEVGDTTPIWFAIRIRDGLLSGLALHDDRASAATDLGA